MTENPESQLPVVSGQMTFKQLKVMAEMLMDTGLLPGLSNTAQAFWMLAKASQQGIPITHVQEFYDVIQTKDKDGRVSRVQFRKKSEIVWTLFRDEGGQMVVHQWDNKIFHATFSFPNSQPVETKVSFDELCATKDIMKYDFRTKKWEVRDVWRRMPKLMLFYRGMRAAVRILAPWCLNDALRPQAETIQRIRAAEVKIESTPIQVSGAEEIDHDAVLQEPDPEPETAEPEPEPEPPKKNNTEKVRELFDGEVVESGKEKKEAFDPDDDPF